MKQGNDQSDDLPQRPEWSGNWEQDGHWDDSSAAPTGGKNAGRKLVDFLAELQSSQDELSPGPIARGGSVQDVLARASLAVPFADAAQRRRRSIRRTIMAGAAVCLAGAVGAAIWILPGVMTPPNEQSTLGTVVSAAETDFARFMASVRQVKMPEASASLPRKPAYTAGQPLTLELPIIARSAASLPVSAVPLAGSNIEASALVERSATMPASTVGAAVSPAGSSGPVDEPPTEVPH